MKRRCPDPDCKADVSTPERFRAHVFDVADAGRVIKRTQDDLAYDYGRFA